MANAILDNKAAGKTSTPEQNKEIQEAVAADPEVARAVLGGALANAVGGEEGITAAQERQQLLGAYAQTLNLITTVCESRETSLALHGFLHRDDCISYWELRGGKSSGWTVHGDRITPPFNIKVYLHFVEPSLENLVDLNLRIRNSSTRRLPDVDVRKNSDWALVENIGELSVAYERLDPDRPTDPNNIFDSLPSARRKTDTIPPGARATLPLLASLETAITTQGYHLAEFRKMLAEADSIRLGNPTKGSESSAG